MNLKSRIHSACLSLIDAKINSLKEQLTELSEGAASEGKSSAGDKHETGRAMAQLEQEKLSKQLGETETQKAILMRTGGILVNANGSYLFISVALGKIVVDNANVMVISPQSPLGMKLAGAKQGESVNVNGTTFVIEDPA